MCTRRERWKESTGRANQRTSGWSARESSTMPCSAMEVNNIPLGTRGRFAGSLRERLGFAIEWFASLAGSWLHGTMASRMAYINHLSAEPELTAAFDRRMSRVRVGLIVMFILCGAWAGVVALNGG